MKARKQTRSFTLKEAKLKAASFCAYQERTQSELREKLLDWGLRYDEAEEIVADLVSEGFVNEERYARTFAGGRFRLKKWGRNKIKYHLKQKHLTDFCINKGLSEIDEEAYWETVKSLAEKKWDLLNDTDKRIKWQKCYRYLMNKGFEGDLIKEALDQIG